MASSGDPRSAAQARFTLMQHRDGVSVTANIAADDDIEEVFAVYCDLLDKTATLAGYSTKSKTAREKADDDEDAASRGRRRGFAISNARSRGRGR